MKKLICISILGLLIGSGCQKKDNQLTDRIAKLEQRIELLEKRLSAAPTPPGQQPEQTQPYDLPVGKSYVLGNPQAPVTLTMFTDIQCPFCERAHSSFVEKIAEDPQLKDKVKVVWKHFPLSFHKNARSASKAAMAAGEQGQDCFWQMAKKLYAGQKELSDENYKKWSKEVKCSHGDGKLAALDSKKFWEDYTAKGNEDGVYDKMIKEDMDLAMNKANVRGTPSFFLNGLRLNQRSVEAVKQMIEEKGMLAGGPGSKAAMPNK
jgi:protein-disulfide isomerase